MGRVRQNMELIAKKKDRNLTFQKRKSGLTKKGHELSILCDVQVCIIIFGPKEDDMPNKPEIWSSNSNEIQDLINQYNGQSMDERRKRIVGISDFFVDRKKKVENKLVKLRKKNDKAKYPTWDDQFDRLSEEELREFGHYLDNSLKSLKTRLEFMKQKQILETVSVMGNSNSHAASSQNQAYFMPGSFNEYYPNPTSMMKPYDLLFDQTHQILESAGAMDNSNEYPEPIAIMKPYAQQFDQTHHGLTSDSMMAMVLMNDANFPQFFGDAVDSHIAYNPPDELVYYDPISTMADPMMLIDPSLPPCHYGQPLLEYPVPTNDLPQMHSSQMNQHYGVPDFQRKNYW